MQQPYTPPPYAPRPPKDKSVALILEILPALFGIFGIGWIYSGQTTTGIMWLVGMLVWGIIAITVTAFTGGFACFCIVPLNIGLLAFSAIMLNSHIKQHPELFGI